MFIEIDNIQIESLKNSKVILFGAGSYGEHALEEFTKRKIKVIAFCDNNYSLQGTELQGYPVISPDDLYRYPDAAIIITSTFYEEIKKQLDSMGLYKVYRLRLGVLHKKILKSDFHNNFLNREESNEFIYQGLVSPTPFFVGRLGSVELECIVHYLYFLNRNKRKDVIKDYPDNVRNMMYINAGFFPPTNDNLDKFSKLYLREMHEMDLIWTMWLSQYEDILYKNFYSNKTIAEYEETYLPYDISVPWTDALEGKRVLVIHPFEESIKENYKIKDKIFKRKLLPDFELKTLKTVQSIAGEPVLYADWFEAIEEMKRKILKIDFDVALIGAGAYGLPLAAFIKQMGRKAIHIGGALQLYFGIKGKAWNNLGIYNDNWTSPKESERPMRYKQVENGRYW